MAKVFILNKMSQFQLHHLRNMLTLPNLVRCITCGPTLTSKNGTYSKKKIMDGSHGFFTPFS